MQNDLITELTTRVKLGIYSMLNTVKLCYLELERNEEKLEVEIQKTNK